MNQATHPKLFAAQHPIQLTPMEQIKVLQHISDLAGQVEGLADKGTTTTTTTAAPQQADKPARKTTITVYLSGPMSGLPELNFPAFNAAAHALRQIGYSVINPAEFKTTTEGMTEAEAWRACMQVDIKALVDCDAIVMLPGWAESRGACLERSIAQGLQMPVMTLTESILEAPTHVEAAYKAVAEMAVAA
jgi:nucleoside 2-deoxyribosyltransferase